MNKLLIISLFFISLSTRSLTASDFFLTINNPKNEVLKSRSGSVSGVLSMTQLPPADPYTCTLECDGRTFTFTLGADLDDDGSADRTLGALPVTPGKSPIDLTTGSITQRRMKNEIVFYCVPEPDNSISKFKTEALATARCEAIRGQSVKKPASLKAGYFLPFFFRIELSEVTTATVGPKRDPVISSTLSMVLTKIEWNQK